MSGVIGEGSQDTLVVRERLRELVDDLAPPLAWPSLWFGLWHLAPVSVSPDGDAARLVIGEVVLGVYLAFLARATYSVWWPIVAHTCAGLVVIW